MTLGIGPAAGLSEHHHFRPEVVTQRKGLGAEIVLEADDIADPDGYFLRITSRK